MQRIRRFKRNYGMAIALLVFFLFLLAISSKYKSKQLPNNDNNENTIKNNKEEGDGMLENRIESYNLVMQGKNDVNVIPDKYNTGCNLEKLSTYIKTAGKYNGINYVDRGPRIVMDMYYSNKFSENTIIVENTDFSAYGFAIYNSEQIKSEIKIVFNNCNFATMSVLSSPSKVTYEFNNCSFTNFSGSNSNFKNCYFGGTANDAINPYINVELEDCYISNLSIASMNVVHCDGTQVFGLKGYTVGNIVYKNCRFEVPSIPLKSSNAYVNSCVTLGLEYSNGDNIVFEDCILNGGGFSIYVNANKPFKVTNVVFRNVQVGSARRYGIWYEKSKQNAIVENVTDTSKLYVGSVWKDENERIHISVTNDTVESRKLKVVTNRGEWNFDIPPCYKSSDIRVEDNLIFDNYPIDIDIIIGTANWVICYDTEVNPDNQIRFVNWTSQDVSFPITKGNCGEKVVFEYFVDEGKLILSGEGSTFNYETEEQPLWSRYRDSIKILKVDEGITSLGLNIFANLVNLEEIELGSTVISINQSSLSNKILSGIKYSIENKKWFLEILTRSNILEFSVCEIKNDGTIMFCQSI